MKTLILLLGFALNLWAADPLQPSMGGKQLIVATNGYAGTLNVRTQLNVGYPGQAGLIVIQSTNGTYALNLFVDSSGNLTLSNNTTLVATLAAVSGYAGGGTKAWYDDGTFKTVTAGATINATDGYVPARADATTFTNSLLHAGSDASTMVHESYASQDTQYQFRNNNTNNSDASITVYLSDSDGIAQDADINIFKGTGWDIGDSAQRNGNINFRTLHGGTLHERFLIAGDAGFTFKDRDGTLNGLLANVSGYTGAGTLFLSDDGTYKVAGGGDTIWTNSAGTISANSTVTDGASAVAFSLNSSNALTTVGSKLATFGNGGTNTVTIDGNGLIQIGNDDSGDDAFSTSYRRGWTFESSRSNYNIGASGWFKALDDSTSAQCYVISSDLTGQDAWQINANAGNSSYLRFQRDNDTYLEFTPNTAATSTPYTFDTSLAHTSGNLLEVANNGSLKGNLTSSGLWEGRAFGATDGTSTSSYYAGFTELIKSDTLYTLNVIALDASDTAPSIRMLSTGETSNFPYVQMRPAEDGSSWTMAQVPFMLNTRTNISDANIIFAVGNNETNKSWITGNGVNSSVGGIASTATDTAVTIASTGWTNTFGKNAVVYIDGTALVYTVYNNASTPIYTNSVALVGSSVLLQPSGKVIITSGVLGVGRAAPF